MTNGREQILGSIRKSLKRGPVTEARASELRAKLEAHRRNVIPQRAAGLDPAAQVELFIRMAEGVQASVARVKSAAEVPGAVADYLAEKNLPSKLVMTPDPRLDGMPWADRPLLEIRRGRAEDGDLTGITACGAGVAETGTLVLTSGPESPTRNNFLPDHHLVVMRRDQVVASYEDAFDRLRARSKETSSEWIPPRTVNFITGPSRTADIEQKIELGAHGPRRLHIILIDEA
ncbi:MAG TPA: lactate utilization protein [Stellaceae bacterium]|nr:lactate utilization protein [Stellaceae bacterium]